MSSSPGTWARRCCDPSRSRTSCPPTGRPSPSSTRTRAATIKPLVRSIGRKFNPACRRSCPRRGSWRSELGYPQRVNGGTRVGWVVREPGPPLHFSLYDEDAQPIGRAKHVMLAIGHGPLAFPGPYGKAREDPRTADRVVQAYEPKQYYEGGRYIVVGSGIASVNEWANAIDAGAQCIALRRNVEPDEQDLNVPRCLFDGSGIDAFQALDFDQRVDFLGTALRGTAPERRGWAAKIRHGRDEGRFEEAIGDVVKIDPASAGLNVTIRHLDGQESDVDVTGIVCGTGFVKSALSFPLFRRLIRRPTTCRSSRERIMLKTNCGVPPLDRDESRLCMMGLNANTIVPERRHDRRAQVHRPPVRGRCVAGGGAEAARRSRSRLGMQVGLARKTARALREVQKTGQITLAMCPTPIGRVHTRVASLTLPAILGLILWLITGREDWIVLIGVYLMLGVALDSIVYPLVLRYQPPWMTFVLAVFEFGLMLILVNALELDLSWTEAIVFFWVSWILAALTKVVVLPIWSLTYLESVVGVPQSRVVDPAGAGVAAGACCEHGRIRGPGQGGAGGVGDARGAAAAEA